MNFSYRNSQPLRRARCRPPTGRPAQPGSRRWSWPKSSTNPWKWPCSTLVEASKKVLLAVPTQREECCHTGGGMAFDKAKNLFLSVGNNTSNSTAGGAKAAN